MRKVELPSGEQVPALGQGTWHMGEDRRRHTDEVAALKLGIGLGMTLIDTAEMYASGGAEEVTREAIAGRRAEIFLVSKVLPSNASHGGVMRACEASLRRLGTDYVDLYQIHRWDDATPIEETMEALHDVVKAGKARYIGASSMMAWQFAKALYTADLHGWTRFVSMQPHYNLLYREEEREMLALCADQGIGVVPWSPLARGRLARAWEDEPSTVRGGSDPWGDGVYAASKAADKAVVDRVGEVAARLGVPRAQVALAWLLHQPVVTAPIVGATRPHHLEEAVAALSISLPPAEIAALEAPYAPHAVAGID